MHVMAITALHQAFVHAVMEGLGEIGLFGGMAAVAKLRLVLHQQELRLLAVMRRMAVEAADAAAGVRRLGKMLLRVFLAVAAQAAAAGFLAGKILEGNDFGHVATAGNMLGTGAVAGLATVAALQRGLEMRGVLEGILVDVFVAGFAGVGAHILRAASGSILFGERARAAVAGASCATAGETARNSPRATTAKTGVLHLRITRLFMVHVLRVRHRAKLL